MSASILATKLYIPPPRPRVVLRPRLIERMNDGLRSGRKLTLISASAGFGKTTLVSEWVAGCERGDPKVRVAWLSLDEGDNDLTRFLTYLVAALQTLARAMVEGLAPSVGAGVLAALQSPQPPPAETLLTALINEIAALPESFVLVLDDYHVLDAKPIDRALAFLLEHLPPQMHLVIATREDPQLPLARLPRPGPIDRAARRRPALHLRAKPPSSSTRSMGLNLSADRHRRAGNPHRRLDRRPATGSPCPARVVVAAGPSGHGQLHRVFHRHAPFHDGLSAGRGAAAADGRGPGVPAGHGDSRSLVWPPV